MKTITLLGMASFGLIKAFTHTRNFWHPSNLLKVIDSQQTLLLFVLLLISRCQYSNQESERI